MDGSPWKLQDAKARFSAVVDAALGGEPQVVTRRGRTAVVVLAASEYERLRRSERVPDLIDHLLAMPRAGAARSPAAKGARTAIRLRDPDLR